MKIEEKNNTIILSNIENFSIKETLECGQYFRYEKIDENYYRIVAHKRVLDIIEDNGEFSFFPSTMKEFQEIWKFYFDLERDYGIIQKRLLKNDKIMSKAIAHADGIRLMNQDPWECLMSFIASQNKTIPMIKQIVNNISERFGKAIYSLDKKEYFSFPDACDLLNAQEEDFRELKAGFRAKYLLDACKKVNNNEIHLHNYNEKTRDGLSDNLQTIYGVGKKISDCVLLFSMEKKESFPIDVWVERIMKELYFNGENVSKKEIQEFAENKFADLGGYAQQYLFYYARENKIAKK